ncbi:MAG: sensor histidine kinase [Candidatus Thorarchaeota archaeon]
METHAKKHKFNQLIKEMGRLPTRSELETMGQSHLIQYIEGREALHTEVEKRGIAELRASEARFKYLVEHLEEEIRIKTEAIIRSEKLVSLGRLGAGVAHEINNPLTGIINYAEIIRDELNTLSKHCKKKCSININTKPFSFLDGIVREGRRIAAIVASLLSFSKTKTDCLTLTNISNIIQNAIELFQIDTNRKQTKIIQILNDDPQILINPQKIQQVVLNILQNAFESILERAKIEPIQGEITIQTIIVNNSPPFLQIIISDNGQGIENAVLPKVLDPFFSTKNTGTGLGLYITYEILKDHNGKINIQSKFGEGTIVTLSLPMDVEP